MGESGLRLSQVRQRLNRDFGTGGRPSPPRSAPRRPASRPSLPTSKPITRPPSSRRRAGDAPGGSRRRTEGARRTAEPSQPRAVSGRRPAGPGRNGRGSRAPGGRRERRRDSPGALGRADRDQGGRRDGRAGTVGVNLDRIRPAVFAYSIAPRLGIEMPRVASGTYASATITTSLTAGSKAKGGAAESTAAAFTVSSVTPKRISVRLGIRIEDVAAVGQANFESILRENLSLVLSDELDDQAINGAGGNSNADLKGIFNGLTGSERAGRGRGDLRYLRRCLRRRDRRALGQPDERGRDRLWSRHLPAVGEVLPRRGDEQRPPWRHRVRRLRDGTHRGLVDQQADAGQGRPHPAGDPPPAGPVGHGGRRFARTGTRSASTTSTRAAPRASATSRCTSCSAT